jgi:O-antigen ligase
VFSGGTGILGLPFARLSGPLVHPNMFGDYLVVSGLVLWSRWPELRGRVRAAGAALGAALVVALVLTASTAWIGAGVVMAMMGREAGASGRSGAGLLLRAGGVVVAAGVFLALVVPLDFHVGWVHVVTNAIRPEIWRSSLRAVAVSPLIGVGAAPYLAQAADPLRGGAVGLWDAHDAYLSVLGQFGVVGLALLVGGAWMIVAPVWRARPSRARSAVLFMTVAVGVHALFLASEDLRHAWMVLGMCGVVAREEA